MKSSQETQPSDRPCDFGANAVQVFQSGIWRRPTGHSVTIEVDVSFVTRFLDLARNRLNDNYELAFRQAIKWCFGCTERIRGEQERGAANTFILLAAFDRAMRQAQRGEKRAARRASHLLNRLSRSTVFWDRFPNLGIECGLRVARFLCLTDVEQAVKAYEDLLQEFSRLMTKQDNEDIVRHNGSFHATVQLELAKCLHHIGSHAEASEYARAAAETFADLGMDGNAHEALATQGLALAAEGHDYKALAVLKRVRDFAEFSGYSARAIAVSQTMWTLLHDRQHRPAARRLLDHAYDILRRCEDTSAQTVTMMARFFCETKAYDRATKLLSEYTRNYSNRGAHRQQIQCLLEQVHLAITTGNLKRGVAALRQARETCGLISGPTLRAELYAYLGHLNYAFGQRFEQAARAFAKACHLHRQHGSLHQVQECHVNYALAACETGAVEETLRALDAALELPLPPEGLTEAHIFVNAASAYSRLARYTEAVNLYQKAFAVFKANQAWRDMAFLLKRLGVTYQYMGRTAAAERCYRGALRFFQGNPTEVAMIANNLATLALEQDDLSNARLWIHQAELAWRRVGTADLPFFLANNLGQVLVALNRPQEALSAFDQAASSGKREKVHPLRKARVKVGRARAYCQLGQREKAFASLTEALIQVEPFRASFKLGRHRSGIMQATREVYAEMVSVCSPLNKPDVAFETIQQANVRALFETLETGQSPKSVATITPEEPIAPSLARAADVAVADPQRFFISEQRAALSASRAAELVGDRVLLQFFLYKDDLHCCVLTRSGVSMRAISVPPRRVFRDELTQLLTGYVSRPRGTELLSKIQRVLGHFYDMLLRPLEDVVAGFDHVVIVPSAELFSVPFGCLFDGEKYFVEQHYVSYLPHVGMLAAPEDWAPPTSWLGFGDPLEDLKYARGEIVEIAKLFENAQLRVGRNATPANLFCSKTDVLHVATRVIQNNESVYAASLQVSGDNGPASLPCSAVAGQDIRARLGVLRCCYTGQAREWFGGEVAAIWTCFLMAGCRAVMASPWQIYETEEVSRVILRFYTLWKDGETPVKAIAKAQREAIQNGAYPSMWGFPLLIGNVV